MLNSTDYATITIPGFVKAMYNIPRNGRSRNIVQLLSDDGDLRSNYLYGLIFIFTFLMITAAVWFLVIIILRILGQKVGCASGRPTTIPAEPISNRKGQSIATDESEEYIVNQADQNRVNRTRIIFLLADLCTLISCGLMGFFLFSFQSSSEDLHDSMSSLRDSFSSVSNNYDEFFFATGTFDSAKNLLMTDLSNFCQTSNGTVDGQDPVLILDSLNSSLTNLDVATPDANWEGLKMISSEYSTIFDEIGKKLTYFKGSMPVWLIVSIFIGVFITLLTIYLFICAWNVGHQGYEFVGDNRRSCKDRLTQNVVSPVYALMIFGMWVLASFLLASSAAVSDFCVDEVTNGDSFLNVIENFAGNQTNIFYQITDNYMHDCANGYMPELDFANEYETKIDAVKSSMSDFLALDVTQLDQACSGDAQAIMTKVQSAMVGINSLYDYFEAVYPSCTKISSVLQPAIYENGCNDFIKDIVRLFAAALPLAVFGTIIVTLRTALFRPRIYLVNERSNENDSYYDESYI